MCGRGSPENGFFSPISIKFAQVVSEESKITESQVYSDLALQELSELSLAHFCVLEVV